MSTSGVALNRDAPQHLTRYTWVEFMPFLQSLHGPCTMTKSSNLVWKTRILITSLHQLAPCFMKLQIIRDQGGITQWAITTQWIKHLHCQGYIPYTAYLDILALSDIHLLLKTGKVMKWKVHTTHQMVAIPLCLAMLFSNLVPLTLRKSHQASLFFQERAEGLQVEL